MRHWRIQSIGSFTNGKPPPLRLTNKHTMKCSYLLKKDSETIFSFDKVTLFISKAFLIGVMCENVIS